MNPLALGAYGLIGWGIYKLAFKKSPVSTQATPVIPSIVKPSAAAAPVSAGSANIAAIQSRLNSLGANPPLAVDGISGPLTLAAIKAFQSANGIEPDGIVGPITQAALDAGGRVIPPVVQPTYVQPAYVAPATPVASFTPVDTSVSTNIQDVHTWADEPEQTLTFRKG